MFLSAYHLAFPDCNSSLNSPMALKWFTKLEAAEKRCPIVFLGHPPISMSYGLEHQRFGFNLSKVTRPVAAIKSLRFALFHNNCMPSRPDTFPIHRAHTYLTAPSHYLNQCWSITGLSSKTNFAKPLPALLGPTNWNFIADWTKM